MGEQHANGSRVSRHRLVADATVGVIANPMPGRDMMSPKPGTRGAVTGYVLGKGQFSGRPASDSCL
jgi:hypothetical protein